MFAPSSEADLLDLSHDNNPAAAARTIRQYWAIGERPIGNMVKLLETKGVRVFSLAENTRNVDAFSCWRNDEPYIFLNTFKSTERSRFDAAHELGHLVLHKHGGARQGRSAEHEAHLFCGLILDAPRRCSVNHTVRYDCGSASQSEVTVGSFGGRFSLSSSQIETACRLAVSNVLYSYQSETWYRRTKWIAA